MPKIISEDFVQRRIVEYLSRIGWGRNLKAKGLNEHGVDIKVRNNNYARYWLIECKGEATANAKSPRSHREVNFNLALGQILTRMHSGGARAYKYRYKYGIGFPASFRDLVMRRLPFDACDKLNLSIFLVEESGTVELVGWRELKRQQSK